MIVTTPGVAHPEGGRRPANSFKQTKERATGTTVEGWSTRNTKTNKFHQAGSTHHTAVFWGSIKASLPDDLLT